MLTGHVPEGRVGWSARRVPALPGRVPAECRIARLGNPGHGLVGRLLGRVVVEQVALVLLSLADAGEGDLVAAHLPLDLARLVVVDPGHRAGDGVVRLLDLEGEFPAVSIHHPGPAEVLGPGRRGPGQQNDRHDGEPDGWAVHRTLRECWNGPADS